jgi:hypothetical protein
MVPKYTIWEAINVAISASMRAMEEIRSLARLPGPRGPDGLGFDDLQVVHDGERKITLRFVRGDNVKEFSFDFPIVIDRGVWKEQSYAKGDGVTWGGQFYIAQRNTEATEKPLDGSSSWRLSIKKGRDGRDGKHGIDGKNGAPGKDGKSWA